MDLTVFGQILESKITKYFLKITNYTPHLYFIETRTIYLTGCISVFQVTYIHCCVICCPHWNNTIGTYSAAVGCSASGFPSVDRAGCNLARIVVVLNTANG